MTDDESLYWNIICKCRNILWYWYQAIYYSDLGKGKLDKRVMLNHFNLAKKMINKKPCKYRNIKGYFKGVLDSEYGQVKSDELLTKPKKEKKEENGMSLCHCIKEKDKLLKEI